MLQQFMAGTIVKLLSSAQRVFVKRHTELLCELDSIEPIVGWFEEEDVKIDSVEMKIPEFQFDDSIPIIENDLHDWLVSAFASVYNFI